MTKRCLRYFNGINLIGDRLTRTTQELNMITTQWSICFKGFLMVGMSGTGKSEILKESQRHVS